MGSPTLGAYGDSITAGTSYVQPLAASLGVLYQINATGGWNQDQLIAAIPNSAAQLQGTTSVILIGVNNTGSNTAAEMMTKWDTIAGLVANPHFVTILPFANAAAWTSGRETVRLAANALLKAAYPNTIDAEAFMGTGSPVALKAAYDSGDGLHLNATGKTALAGHIFANWT